MTIMEAKDTGWEFWYAIRKAAAILERDAEAVVSAELGISFGQFMVLSVIEAHPGPLIQTAIADHLGLTKATVSRLIEQGSRAGWISVGPDPASRRSRLISLTAAGEDLVRRGDAALEASTLASIQSSPAPIRAATATITQVIETLRGPQDPHRTALPASRHPMGNSQKSPQRTA